MSSSLILFGVFALLGHCCGQCYDGWVYWGGSCYGFGEELVSWPGAASLCRIFEAALVEIETTEENEFVKAHAKNHSDGAVWLGATDVFSEGQFVWITSKRLVSSGFADWAPGEPNHEGGVSNEDCLNMYGRENYQWNDEDCSVLCQFVCEIQLEEGHVTPAHGNGQQIG